MKVTMSVKADELRSSSTVQLTLDSSLYNHAAKRINELAVELKKMNDDLAQETNDEDVSLG